jgi:flagellar basal-body rod modification protein FlgD
MATSFDSTLTGLGINRPKAGVSIAPAAAANQPLTQGDFIALMTAQMKNQDPFEPVDNSQMVAQMAQFSSLAGISEMSSTLKAIATKLGSTSTGDALSYVGKTVLTEGSTAYPRTGGGLAGAVEIDAAATKINLTITSAAGEILKTVDLGAHDAGTLNFDWDGSTDGGTPAGDGPFTITAQARDGTKSVASRTLVWAPVTSVSMPTGKEAVLTLPGIGQIPVSAVRSIG